jgi:hypothetical protein
MAKRKIVASGALLEVMTELRFLELYGYQIGRMKGYVSEYITQTDLTAKVEVTDKGWVYQGADKLGQAVSSRWFDSDTCDKLAKLSEQKFTELAHRLNGCLVGSGFDATFYTMLKEAQQ